MTATKTKPAKKSAGKTAASRKKGRLRGESAGKSSERRISGEANRLRGESGPEANQVPGRIEPLEGETDDSLRSELRWKIYDALYAIGPSSWANAGTKCVMDLVAGYSKALLDDLDRERDETCTQFYPCSLSC